MAAPRDPPRGPAAASDPAAAPSVDYAVFVSHSLAWGDELLISQLCGQLRRRHGLVCHVARRNWKFGPSVITELEEAIGSTDCVLAIAMNDGTATSYVNQEVGIARAMRKPVVGIAEKSAHLSPLFQKIPDLLVVDFDSPSGFPAELYSRLQRLGNEPCVTSALYWVLMGSLGGIFASRE